MQFKVKNIILFSLFSIFLIATIIILSLLLIFSDNQLIDRQLIQFSIIIIIIISIVTLLVFIMILIKILNNFLNPLKYSTIIMNKISKGDGNLEIKLSIKNKDEAGSFISAFNEFIKNIKTLIETISLTASQSVHLGNKQSNMIEITLKAVENISYTINTLKNQSTLLADNIDSSSNSIENISINIKDLIQKITIQSKTVSETLELINTMKNSIENVAKIAQEKKNITDNLGNITIIEELRVEGTNKIIKDISKSIDDMLDMIETINNISSQTNLLSMNAAIEAAQAGESGKGFAVVADEIGKLADSTGEKAKNISESLKTLIKNINHALDSSEESGKSFKNINKEVTNVIDAFSDISETTNALLNGTKEVTATSNSLKSITNNIDNKSSMMLSKVNDINKTIINIKNASNKSLTEIDQIKKKTNEINSAIIEIAHYTIENNNNIVKLNEDSNKFTQVDKATISSDTATKKLMQFIMMNMQNIGKKLFFLYPPEKFNNKIIMEMVGNGYEIYIMKDHINILKILKKYNNSFLFINIDKILNEVQWEEYIKDIIFNPATKEIKIGIISDKEDKAIKQKYLLNLNIPCGFIKLTENFKNNLIILNTIIESNEIRPRRQYIRVNIEKEQHSKFDIKVDNTIYTGNIIDLSIAGLRCIFSASTRFVIDKEIENINLDLAGTFINLKGKITMYHEGSNSYVIMFDNLTDSNINDKLLNFIFNLLQKTIEQELKN